VPQGRRELDEAVLTELPHHLVVELLIGPVRPTGNGALLVVELRVEQYQAVQFVRTLSRVIGADTASEARSQQTASTSAGRFPDTGQCHADVVQDRRERQLLLTTLAVTMTTLIKPQARLASLSEPVSEACEVQLICSRS
jgi:hypothetical protein